MIDAKLEGFFFGRVKHQGLNGNKSVRVTLSRLSLTHYSHFRPRR